MSPDTTDAVDLRCAPWTADLGVDPIGSTITIERLVTVEVPLPWPADVGESPWISDLTPPPGCRVQAIVPEVARPDGTVLVTRWERRGATLAGTDWYVAAGDVPRLLAEVCAGGDATHAHPAPAPPEVLVCGHGSRDRCCGNSGTRIAIEARAALPDTRIRRTSHLGGHRFAPTALTLPDGRCWAFLDCDALVGIVERSMHPHDARDHYRGNSALAPEAQVVEGALLSTGGWESLDVDELHAEVDHVGGEAHVVLHWDGVDGPGSRSGTVTVHRRYPVLRCGLPPEDATKDASEFRLR